MWNFFSRVQLDTNSMQFIFSCSIPYSFTSLTHEIASWTLEEKFPIKVHLCIAWQKIPIVFEICDSLGKELQKEEFDKVENECHCNLSFFKLTKPCWIWQPKTTTKKLSRVLLSFVGWCILQYCTGHPVLRIKSRNQANERARIPRTWHCFSINGPSNEVRCSLTL